MTIDSRGWRRTALHSPSVERAGLVEDAVGDAELADVVQERGAAQEPPVGVVEPIVAAMPSAISATPAQWRAV